MNDSNKQQDTATEPPPQAPPSALAIIGGGLVVIASSAMAFFMTCYPAGLIGLEMTGAPLADATAEEARVVSRVLIFAVGVGTCAALFVGYMVYRAFRKHWRKQ